MKKKKKTKAAPKKTSKKAAVAKVDDPAVGMDPCHFCKKEVDKKDMYCFGCKTVICDECDVSMGGFGHGHSPEEHLERPEHETW